MRDGTAERELAQGLREGIYEVPRGTNILTAIRSLLALDRGNGYTVDRMLPVFSDYWNSKTVKLQDGTTQSVLLTPYTYRCDSSSGSYADVLEEMNTIMMFIAFFDR